MKRKNEDEMKVRMSLTINKKLIKIVEDNFGNRSKYIEWLIREDLNKNNQLKDI